MIERWGLVVALIYVMARFRDVVLYGGTCLECGGHGKHRGGCRQK